MANILGSQKTHSTASASNLPKAVSSDHCPSAALFTLVGTKGHTIVIAQDFRAVYKQLQVSSATITAIAARWFLPFSERGDDRSGKSRLVSLGT